MDKFGLTDGPTSLSENTLMVFGHSDPDIKK